ncbi:protein phosphatase, partial [Streptomyces sp. 2MCAF27]
AQGGFGPPGSGDPSLGGPPEGSYGAYADGDFAKKGGRKKWIKRSLYIALGLAVVGGGLYGGYRWTQTQYYVGANGDHVAIYQGISQDLAWIKLNKVHEDHREIELKYLPVDQRSRVEDTIAVSSLGQAKDKTKDLATLASACKKSDAQRQAEEKQQDLTNGKDKNKNKAGGSSGGKAQTDNELTTNAGEATTPPAPGGQQQQPNTNDKDTKSPSSTPSSKPSSSATPKPGPTLSEEEQKLVPQCSSAQQ